MNVRFLHRCIVFIKKNNYFFFIVPLQIAAKQIYGNGAFCIIISIVIFSYCVNSFLLKTPPFTK